jgi:hypothetical protein
MFFSRLGSRWRDPVARGPVPALTFQSIPMRASFVRAVPVAALLLAACGPSDLVGKDVIADLHAGMSRDSVLTVLGTGSLTPNQPSDYLRLVKGFRQQQFFTNGAMYQIIWYREKPGSVEEPIARETDTPVLLQADTVVAAGWADFDEAASRLNLPNPYRSQERLDSLAGRN